MRRRILFLLLSMATLPASAAQRSARVRLLRFDQAWTRADFSRAALTQPASFDVRRSTGGQILLSLRDATGGWSDQHYGIGPRGQAPPKAVSLAEWRNARPAVSSATATPLFSQDLARRAIRFRGQTFTASGQTLGQPAGILSPDQRTLAVFSYKARNTNVSAGVLASEPPRGRLWIELFNVADGKRLAAVDRRFNGFPPSLLFSSARWALDHSFIMPTDFLSREALWVTLNEKGD
jgi:hypothetical protein